MCRPDPMTREEVDKELELLRAAGLNPQLCDTEVPLVDVPVLAGHPAESGDATASEYVLLPKELVGRHPVFLIEVAGLSMHHADIMPGDRLEVQMDSDANDGDIVVAEVDGVTLSSVCARACPECPTWTAPRQCRMPASLLTTSHAPCRPNSRRMWCSGSITSGGLSTTTPCDRR